MFYTNLEPPFDCESLELLENIIKNAEIPPPQDWPLVECTVLYFCGTYAYTPSYKNKKILVY